MKLILFKNAKGKWSWHVKARNGRLVCTAGEDFASKRNAVRAAMRVAVAVLEAHMQLLNENNCP